MIIIQAILLTLAFTIRYNALYYPFISVIAILLSDQSIRLKVAGIGISIAFVGGYMFYTSNQLADITGQRQFSAFGGWKIANNALYIYAHVPQNELIEAPEKFRSLDSIVQVYFHSNRDIADEKKNDYTSGSYFMFNPNSPLVRHLADQYGGNWGSKEWMLQGELYESYGFYLIKTYPLTFTRYFLWPNFLRYAFPPGEVLASPKPFFFEEKYGGIFVRQLIKIDYITPSAFAVGWSLKILSFYPMLFALIHTCFFLGLLGFIFNHGYMNMNKNISKCFILILSLWIIDFVFSVFSAGIVLRYQAFLVVQELAFGILLIEHTYRSLNRNNYNEA